MAKTIRSKGQEALCLALVKAQKRASLSQTELAIKLRHHQSFVAHVESGERRIDVVELIAFSRAIGLDPFEILAIVEAATEPDHKSENEEWPSCPTSAALSLGGLQKDQLV